MHRTFKQAIANVALVALIQTVGPFGISAAVAGVKGSTSQVNIDQHGVALGGYDPVAYFEDGKPTPGLASLSGDYGGAHYLFATPAHLKTFLADPRKFVPEFGGFCAVGTAYGEKVDADPTTGRVVDGKLYVNNSPHVLELFEKDRAGFIVKAQTNWPVVRDKPF